MSGNITTPAHLERHAALGKTDRLFLTLGSTSDVDGLVRVIRDHFQHATRVRIACDNSTMASTVSMETCPKVAQLWSSLGQCLAQLQQVQITNFGMTSGGDVNTTSNSSRLPLHWLTGLLQQQSLDQLELYGVHLVAFSKAEVTHFCDAVSHLRRLTHVEWCFCRMSRSYTTDERDESVFGRVMRALARVSSLRVVELSGEYTHDEDSNEGLGGPLHAEALGDLCRGCPQLVKLSLNNVTVEGHHVQHMLEPLATPACVLVDLRLCLTRSGVVALHDVIQTNRSLEACWIWPRQPSDWNTESNNNNNNNNDDEQEVDCLIHLSHALRTNDTLQDFRVWGLNVRLCAAQEAAFAAALQVNTRLTTLKLGAYAGPQRHVLDFYLRLNAVPSNNISNNGGGLRRRVLRPEEPPVDMIRVLAEHARDFPALAYYVRVHPTLWLPKTNAVLQINGKAMR